MQITIPNVLFPNNYPDVSERKPRIHNQEWPAASNRYVLNNLKAHSLDNHL
jgi:hypothetical protein